MFGMASYQRTQTAKMLGDLLGRSIGNAGQRHKQARGEMDKGEWSRMLSGLRSFDFAAIFDETDPEVFVDFCERAIAEKQKRHAERAPQVACFALFAVLWPSDMAVQWLPSIYTDLLVFAVGVALLTLVGCWLFSAGEALVVDAARRRRVVSAACAMAIRFSVATSLAVAMAVAFYGDWWDVIPWCWCGW